MSKFVMNVTGFFVVKDEYKHSRQIIKIFDCSICLPYIMYCNKNEMLNKHSFPIRVLQYIVLRYFRGITSIYTFPTVLIFQYLT